jgi:hypothetical protein
VCFTPVHKVRKAILAFKGRKVIRVSKAYKESKDL